MRTILYLLFFSLPFVVTAQRGHLYNEGIFYIGPGALLTAKANFVNKATGSYINDGEVLLEGNFYNDGITSFTAGLDGYTRFQGVELPQEIGGLIGADFYHVLFDNPADAYSFYLSGDIVIFGEAAFQQGIIDNINYSGSLTFEQDGKAVGAHDQSYVEGEVHKFGDNSFIFPIGKERMYRPGGVIQLNDSIATFTGEYVAYNSNNDYAHNRREEDILKINDKEYWILEKATASSDVLIQLSWDERITPSGILEDLESLAILAWDPLALQWISLDGVVDEAEQSVTSISVGQAYDVFTLGSVRQIPDYEDLFAYNAVNPNDPGGNDYFKIIGLEEFPDNRVRIYNRWGVLVFDEHSYDTSNNVFRGISQGFATVKKKEELPVGTYFYLINYVEPETNKSKSKLGYLYLNR